MPTPHISAPRGSFAETVLLPGDPLRARFVAETYLDGARQLTSVRNMEGYTGEFEGRPVSVMGTGMGIPSISIYARELAVEYGCRRLVRIGSCGSLQPGLPLRDLVIVTGASTDSQVNRQRFRGLDFAACADFAIVEALVGAARAAGLAFHVGTVYSSDLFYGPDPAVNTAAAALGMLAVEMECAGLFGVAAECGVQAGAIMTVSDHLPTHTGLSSEERQTGFRAMVEVALRALVGA